MMFPQKPLAYFPNIVQLKLHVRTKTNAALTQLMTNPMGENRNFEVIFLPHRMFGMVKGWSIGENISSQYAPFIYNIALHLELNNYLTLQFRYELFNDTTAKYLLKIIRIMNAAHRDGKRVKINWCCTEDNREMIEMGYDLKELCQFELELNFD